MNNITIIPSHCGINVCIQQTVMLFDMNNMLKKKKKPESQTDEQTQFKIIVICLKWSGVWLGCYERCTFFILLYFPS